MTYRVPLGGWTAWAEENFEPIPPTERPPDDRNMFRCRRCGMAVFSYRRHAVTVHGDEGIELAPTAEFHLRDGWDVAEDGRALWIGPEEGARRISMK